MNDVKELESLTDTQSRQEIVEDISDMALPITTHAIERNFPKTSKVNKLLLNKTNKKHVLEGRLKHLLFSLWKIILQNHCHTKKPSKNMQPKKKKKCRKRVL